MSVMLKSRVAATDHRPTIEKLTSQNRSFLAGVPSLGTLIDDRDGMLAGNAEYYFLTGRSALDVIDVAIRFSRFRHKRNVRSVLDFACGYGRVLRWLHGSFDHAEILGVDVDANAVASVRELLDVDAAVIDPAWREVPERRFDLIWMGSLLTHLSQRRCIELLTLLRTRLNDGGLLVATLHGPYVARRLASLEKTYNLTPAAAAAIVHQFEDTGFGFQAYEGMTDYGISITDVARLEELGRMSGMSLGLYIEKGWIDHQDVFACMAA